MSKPRCIERSALFAGALALCSWVILEPLPGLSQSATVNTSIIADNQEDTYRRCLSAAEVNPDAGLDMARRWRNLGGGEPAEHCAALAMLSLGDSEEAAHRLLDLAERSTGSHQVRAGLFGHAARAMMDIGAYGQAVEVLDEAIGLNGSDSAFFLDRALCHAAIENYWAAIDDLNVVLDRHASIEALILRGSAYRRLNITDLASDDVNRALAIEPDNVNALLEKGLLEQQSGDVVGARKSWMRVLALAPDSPAADAVRGHLERLDVIVDPLPEEAETKP